MKKRKVNQSLQICLELPQVMVTISVKLQLKQHQQNSINLMPVMILYPRFSKFFAFFCLRVIKYVYFYLKLLLPWI